MKRLFSVVVAVLSITATFAKSEEVAYVSVAEESSVNVKDYDMRYDIRRLGETLGLTVSQMATVADLNRGFCADMMAAAAAKTGDRESMVGSAVAKDLKYMSYVLTPEQFGKYRLLLNTTLVNRGLSK